MKAKKSYFIDWSDKDPYIIENYNKMTIKEIAKNLDVNYGTLYHRIKILREKGIIDYKEVVKVQKPIEFTSKIDILDGNLEIGRKYKVKKLKGDDRSKENLRVEGILEEKYDNYYVFKDYRGFRECFLKKDFIIGEYGIKEVE